VKTLWVADDPLAVGRWLWKRGEFDRAVTPTAQAARALGVRPWRLEQVAKGLLGDRREVPLVTGARAWRAAVQKHLEPQDVHGMARLALPIARSLGQWGTDLGALQGAPETSPRGQRLAQAAQTWRQTLGAQGYLDSSWLLWEAARGARASAAQAILVYGYFDLGADGVAFVDAIAAPASAVVFPADEPVAAAAIAALKQRGWQIKRVTGVPESGPVQGAKPSPPLPRVHHFATPQAEVRWAIACVKDWLLQGVSPQEIALVARDERAYGEWLLEAAWEAQVPLRVLFEVPVAETQTGGWVLQLLKAAAANFPCEETTRLLHHPFCKPRSLPLGDHEAWPEVRRRRPQGLDAWAALGIPLDFLALPKGRRDRAAWVGWLQGIFSTVRLGRGARSRSQEAVAHQKLMGHLRDLEQPSGQKLTFSAFSEELRELLALLTVPVEPRRGGVELHQPKALQGASYRYAIVLGMAEGTCPPLPKADIFLDAWERKQLRQKGFAVEDAIAVAQREWFNFRAVLRATETTFLTYPRLIGQLPQRPSPYLDRLDLAPDIPRADPPHPIIATRQQARILQLQTAAGWPEDDPVLPWAARAWRVERDRELGKLTEFDGVLGAEYGLEPRSRSFSASQLIDLGQCEFKWFAKHLLKAQDFDEADDELSPSKTGNFYHRVLEKALKTHQLTTPQACLDRLEELVREVEEEDRLHQILGWSARRPELIKTLQTLIQSDYFLPDGIKVLGCEWEFSGDYFGLKINGKIDRIDQRSEELVLIDYKSGKTITPQGPKDEQGRRTKVDIQLTLYDLVAAPALAQEFKVKNSTVDAFYYSIKAAEPMRAERDESILEALAQHVKHTLKTGAYPVNPDRDRHACQYCSSHLMCRTGDRLQQRYGHSA
jgi:hypothetical protein